MIDHPDAIEQARWWIASQERVDDEVVERFVRGFDLTSDVAFNLIVTARQDIPEQNDTALLSACWRAEKRGDTRPGSLIVPSWSPPAEDWRKPEPLGVVDLPPFPLHALPGWIQEWCEAIALSTQTPPDLAAMLALSVLSAALAKKVKVVVKGDWSEPVNIWVVVVMAPSSGKSPVFRRALEPLRQWERESDERIAAERIEAKDHLEIEEGVLARLVEKARKAKDKIERADLREQIKEQRREIEKVVVPSSDVLIADNSTPEALNGLLAKNHGRIAVMSDEGGIFALLAGRYSNGNAAVDDINKGFTGEQIRVNRRTRDEYIDNPAVTMGVTVQPVVLKELWSNEAMRGRGFLARPLVVVPRSNVGYRDSPYRTPAVPAHLSAAFADNVKSLLAIDLPDEPRVLPLDKAAIDVIEGLWKNLEPRRRPGDDMASAELAEWSGKLHSSVHRIAALLQMADNPSAAGVDAEHAWAAVQIGRYCIAHAQVAFAAAAEPKDVQDARKLLALLVRLDKSPVTRREVHQRIKRQLNASELDEAALVLEAKSYLRRTSDNKRYHLHPELGTLGTLGDASVPS